MCSALDRHARSRALKMLLADVAVSKNLPLCCRFFLEILRGATDVVLIWFGLDVTSASFSVTRTLQSWEAALTIRATKSSSPFVTCHSRAMDNQSLGSSPLWNSICDAVTALLIFSGLHSYKVITGPRHMSQWQYTWAFLGFLFPFIVCVSPSHCFPNWNSLKEKLMINCRNGSEVTVTGTKQYHQQNHCQWSRKNGLAGDWWKINLPSFCCFFASTRSFWGVAGIQEDISLTKGAFWLVFIFLWLVNRVF